MSIEFDFLSASTLRRLIRSRQVSPVELTRRALAKAEETQDALNGFTVVMHEQALESARRAERAVMDGSPLGLLHGIPISVKDLISAADMPYSFGSRTMAENIATVDAPAVERVKQAGAVILGKTTTSEFGSTVGGNNPLTGVTRNPWDLSKSPGGSSAGAAATVAAGVTPFGLATDAAGSVRVPASFTGLVGIKATFGRVPAWPVTALPTLAHVCPIARTVDDAALLLSAIAGYDERDPFAVTSSLPDVLGACQSSAAGLRIGWSRTLGFATPDPEVVRILDAAVNRFESLGCDVEHVEQVLDADPAPIWTAEFHAGIAMRFRGLESRQRSELSPLLQKALDEASRQTMPEYLQAVSRRFALRDRLRGFFENYDLLICPIAPVTSLRAEEDWPDHLAGAGPIAWVQYPYAFNLTGNPVATVCAGLAGDGMPVGVQIVGRLYDEVSVVRAAAAFERSWEPGYNLPPAQIV